MGNTVRRVHAQYIPRHAHLEVAIVDWGRREWGWALKAQYCGLGSMKVGMGPEGRAASGGHVVHCDQ